MPHIQDESSKARYFAHERLDAYHLSLESLRLLSTFKEKLRGLPGGLAAQLERAVVGAFSNLCAGAAAQGAESRRHFRISLSEAGEAAGCAEGVLVLGALTQAEYDRLRTNLSRLSRCLYGLSR